MSNRRTAATAATAADKAARRSNPRTDVNPASGAITLSERLALADGIRAGAKQRLRLAARSIMETAAALRADGYPVTDEHYVMPDTDADGAPLDAREVLREAAERAKPGRGFGTGYNDPARMTAADVASIAAYGAACGARMARPALTETEREDVYGAVLEAVLSRGADATDRRCAEWFHAPYGTVRSDARTLRLEGGLNTLPRWDALIPADYDGAPLTAERTRDRWKGFAYMTARRILIDERGARLRAETPADWSGTAEDEAPTPEQIAAHAADVASAALDGALEAVAPLTHFLSATAPGGALKRPEVDALSIALTGMTRAELAAARNVDATAVKMSANRGRKALAARVATESDARRWAADADRRNRRILSEPTELDRLARIAAGRTAPYRGARMSWPDRIGTITPEGEYTVPPAPSGAGTRANLPGVGRTAAEIGYRPQGRRTLASPLAPGAHRALAPLARALRTLRNIDLPPVSTLDTASAVEPTPHPPIRYRSASRPVTLPDPTAPRLRRPALTPAQEADRYARFCAGWDAARATGADDASCARAAHAAAGTVGNGRTALAHDPEVTRAVLAAHAARAAAIERLAAAPRKPLEPITPRERTAPRIGRTFAGESARLWLALRAA